MVLLDNFEDVVDGETGKLHDQELEEALRALLELPAHGVKVIITTRVAPRALLLLRARAPALVLALDEGLPSPFAENILRAQDPDGKLGLRDAPEALLATARERTQGYPRALEALAAILAADRSTTLEEVLADTERLLPEQVVEALVGEAFSRLDPLAQQVMQALAALAAPVPEAAVDYVLQPHVPGIDSAPVLRRLVNMRLCPTRGRALPSAPGRPQLRYGTDPRGRARRPGRLAAPLHPLRPAASGRGVLPEHSHPPGELEDRR